VESTPQVSRQIPLLLVRCLRLRWELAQRAPRRLSALSRDQRDLPHPSVMLGWASMPQTRACASRIYITDLCLRAAPGRAVR
jgi:hypothetical protein